MPASAQLAYTASRASPEWISTREPARRSVAHTTTGILPRPRSRSPKRVSSIALPASTASSGAPHPVSMLHAACTRPSAVRSRPCPSPCPPAASRGRGKRLVSMDITASIQSSRREKAVPTRAPIDTPTMADGESSSASNALRTPTWAYPLAPPPARTSVKSAAWREARDALMSPRVRAQGTRQCRPCPFCAACAASATLRRRLPWRSDEQPLGCARPRSSRWRR